LAGGYGTRSHTARYQRTPGRRPSHPGRPPPPPYVRFRIRRFMKYALRRLIRFLCVGLALCLRLPSDSQSPAPPVPFGQPFPAIVTVIAPAAPTVGAAAYWVAISVQPAVAVASAATPLVPMYSATEVLQAPNDATASDTFERTM